LIIGLIYGCGVGIGFQGWKLASEVEIKLDKRNRRLVLYLTFARGV